VQDKKYIIVHTVFHSFSVALVIVIMRTGPFCSSRVQRFWFHSDVLPADLDFNVLAKVDLKATTPRTCGFSKLVFLMDEDLCIYITKMDACSHVKL
jgi:hypothetical protein